MRAVKAVAAAGVVAGLGSLAAAWALSLDDLRGAPAPPVEEIEYNGRLTFARIRFDPIVWGRGPYRWGLDLKWNHDYPHAEQNFMKIIDELTGVDANSTVGNVIDLTDPRLFEHPWIYLCEPGFWDPTEAELDALRAYIAKGGFVLFDDFFDFGFGGINIPRQWANFERQMQRLLPGVQLFELTIDHPIFRTFFKLEDLDFDIDDPRLEPIEGSIWGVFEDNDPSKRLVAVANYNMDIGDFWEWSDQDLYPVPLTQKGFRVGVNYLMYALTH